MLDIYDDEEREYENEKELDEILFSMSSNEFIEEELDDQIENIFGSNRKNHVDFYISKYKLLKEEHKDNDEFLGKLKDEKEKCIEHVIETVSQYFQIGLDTEDLTTKMAKVLYTFFIVDYKENLETYFLNFIQKNKKNIVDELKRMKKPRDVSTLSNKAKFINTNDALIINNINTILFDIIPNTYSDNFLNYILETDDDVIFDTLAKYIEKEKILITEETYEAFLRPFVDREDSYSEVISDIVIELTGSTKQNELDELFNDENEDDDNQ